MKKALSLLMILSFVLLLCACSDKDTSSSGGNTVDVTYSANLGKIPECEISLGETAEQVKEKWGKIETSESGEPVPYSETVGENNVLLSNGTYDLYYKKADAQKKISYIVSYDDAFGFHIGDVIVDVQKNLEKYGVTQKSGADADLFFYLGDAAATDVLQVEFDKNTLLFVFEDNALSTTVLYNREAWNS